MKRKKSIVKQLEEKYGRKWKHHPFSGVWVCEELDLIVVDHYHGGYDVNGLPLYEKPPFEYLNVSGLDIEEKFYYE